MKSQHRLEWIEYLFSVVVNQYPYFLVNTEIDIENQDVVRRLPRLEQIFPVLNSDANLRIASPDQSENPMRFLSIPNQLEY